MLETPDIWTYIFQLLLHWLFVRRLKDETQINSCRELWSKLDDENNILVNFSGPPKAMQMQDSNQYSELSM